MHQSLRLRPPTPCRRLTTSRYGPRVPTPAAAVTRYFTRIPAGQGGRQRGRVESSHGSAQRPGDSSRPVPYPGAGAGADPGAGPAAGPGPRAHVRRQLPGSAARAGGTIHRLAGGASLPRSPSRSFQSVFRGFSYCNSQTENRESRKSGGAVQHGLPLLSILPHSEELVQPEGAWRRLSAAMRPGETNARGGGRDETTAERRGGAGDRSSSCLFLLLASSL